MPARQWINKRVDGEDYSVIVRLEYDRILTDQQYADAEETVLDTASQLAEYIWEF